MKQFFAEPCNPSKSAFWNSLFMIQTLKDNPDQGCSGHFWYLSVEMTCFWYIPLVIWAYLKTPLFGFIMIWVTQVFNIIMNMVVTYQKNVGVTGISTCKDWS